jgi:uncharacterized protein
VFVVDTNVLIYAADQESFYHARCCELLEGWRSQPSAWYVTWPILYEFLRVSTHPRVFRTAWPVGPAWSFVEAILAAPALSVLIPTDRHAQVASEVIQQIPHLRGNLMHDAHTAVLMREHGIRRIYTRDTDFHRFSFIEPLDPLS